MDIEEDIKILKNLKKYLNLLIYEGTHKIIYNDLGWDEKTIDCINAIEHILAEREADKKKIKELEKENRILLNSKIGTDLSYDDYIPKQKVKDVVKEAIEIIESEQFKVIMGDMTKVNRLKWLLKKELLEDK